MINIYFTHALFLLEESRFDSAWYHSTPPQIIIGPFTTHCNSLYLVM